MSDSPEAPEKVSVLFCCLGNICRSTMAEGVFQSLTKKAESSPYKQYIDKVDSCGTGAYHSGEDADPRTLKTLANHGIKYRGEARQLEDEDFHNFDYIFGMDTSNVRNIERARKGIIDGPGKAKVMLFGEYSGTGSKEVIDDPWYGSDRNLSGFERAYSQAMRFSLNFLQDQFPDASGADDFILSRK